MSWAKVCGFGCRLCFRLDCSCKNKSHVEIRDLLRFKLVHVGGEIMYWKEKWNEDSREYVWLNKLVWSPWMSINGLNINVLSSDHRQFKSAYLKENGVSSELLFVVLLVEKLVLAISYGALSCHWKRGWASHRRLCLCFVQRIWLVSRTLLGGLLVHRVCVSRRCMALL
jgi:hypothetical protein